MAINTHLIRHYICHFFSAKRKGHGIHSPFAYQLCEEVFYNHNSFYDLEALKTIREQLLADETEVAVEDFGAGSKTFSGSHRKIKHLAARGTSTLRQSEILYRLVHFLRCKNGIELGTSIGITTLYLAKGMSGGGITSIEGSSALHAFAKMLAVKNNTHNIRFVHARFNEALPGLLDALGTLDFLYADGNHTYEATLDYFNYALNKKHNDSVFVFDDIYWSKGMTRAWQKIQQHPGVTLSLDCFYFGLVFFKKEVKEKVALSLFL